MPGASRRSRPAQRQRHQSSDAQSAEHTNHHDNAGYTPGQGPGQAQQEQVVPLLALGPGMLLNGSPLHQRGNGPVRTALIQSMQQTMGNRAVQRLLQRTPAGRTTATAPDAPIQRGGPTAAAPADAQTTIEEAIKDESKSKIHKIADSPPILNSASEAQKLSMIRILLDGWTGTYDEKALERIWRSFPNLVEAASRHFDLFEQSVDDGAEFPDVFEDIEKRYVETVIGIAKQYLAENKKFAQTEQKRLGLDKTNEPPTADQAKEMQETQKAAADVEKAIKTQQRLAGIPVGFRNANNRSNEGSAGGLPAGSDKVLEIVGFDPDPAKKPDPALTPPGTTVGNYEAVKKAYDDATQVVTNLTNKYPALYVMFKYDAGTEPGNRGVAATEKPVSEVTPAQARERMTKAMNAFIANIDEVAPKVGPDIHWYDLQPIMDQVKKNNYWSQKLPQKVINDVLKDKERRDYWVAMGLTTAAAGAFIVGTVAGGGIGGILIAGGIIIGLGQAAASLMKYAELAQASATTVKDDKAIVSEGQVQQARVEAFLNTAMAVADMYAPLKGAVQTAGKGGLKALQAVSGRAAMAAREAELAARVAKQEAEVAKLTPEIESVEKAAREAEEAAKRAKEAEARAKAAPDASAENTQKAESAAKEAEAEAKQAKEAEAKAKAEQGEGKGTEGADANKAVTTGTKPARLTKEAYDAAVAAFRKKLEALGLDGAAIDRVLAKTDGNQIKGQLFEELRAMEVNKELADKNARAARLGSRANDKVEYIQGHRIQGTDGRQISDGMLVVDKGTTVENGVKVRDVEILEAEELKAGEEAKRGLKSKRESLAKMGKDQRFEAFMDAVEDLKGSRPDLAEKYRKYKQMALKDVKTGKSTAVDAVEDLYKTGKIESELLEHAEQVASKPELGQVNRTTDRFSPNVDLETGADIPATFLIDGELARVSNTGRIKVKGVLPKGVSPGRIEKDVNVLKRGNKVVTDKGANFEITNSSVEAKELDSLSKEFEGIQKARPDAPGQPSGGSPQTTLGS